MKSVTAKDRVHFLADQINNGLIRTDSICDLGARDEVLRELITRPVKYQGVDIYPVGEHTIYSDIEDRIELPDGSYDLVAALDVLEHTNNIESATDELLRICGHQYFINLPNELNYFYRVKLMFGRVSGKFKLNLDSKDRHRWFFTKDNVERFVAQTGISKTNYEIIAFYKRRRILGILANVFRGLGLHSIGASSFIVIGTVPPNSNMKAKQMPHEPEM